MGATYLLKIHHQVCLALIFLHKILVALNTIKFFMLTNACDKARLASFLKATTTSHLLMSFKLRQVHMQLVFQPC